MFPHCIIVTHKLSKNNHGHIVIVLNLLLTGDLFTMVLI